VCFDVKHRYIYIGIAAKCVECIGWHWLFTVGYIFSTINSQSHTNYLTVPKTGGEKGYIVTDISISSTRGGDPQRYAEDMEVNCL